MTKEELALKLNRRDRRARFEKTESAEAKENGLIIIYGESDDLVEFEGLLYDEIGAYDGTDFIIATKGMEIPSFDDEKLYYKAEILQAIPIEEESTTSINRFKAVWNDEGNPCWEIQTELPHAKFEILEDGELFGIGIVIDFKDLSKKQIYERRC